MFLRVVTARANVARALLAAGSAAGGIVYGQISTLAFVGIEVRPVEVQVRITPGQTALVIVGLPDKAVAESRERAPADLPKEGSQFDLPIVLAMMVAMEAVAPDAVAGYAAIGELALDGSIRTVPGALAAAIGANAMGNGLICPAACGPEAAWAGEDVDILAAPHLLPLVNHFKGQQTLSRPKPNAESTRPRSRICATSKARRVPSSCSRWRLPAVQPLDDRTAGRGQVHCPRSFPRWRPRRCWKCRWCTASPASSWAGARERAPVPGAAPLGEHVGAGRRRHAAQARRGEPRASGCAVPR